MGEDRLAGAEEGDGDGFHGAAFRRREQGLGGGGVRLDGVGLAGGVELEALGGGSDAHAGADADRAVDLDVPAVGGHEAVGAVGAVGAT